MKRKTSYGLQVGPGGETYKRSEAPLSYRQLRTLMLELAGEVAAARNAGLKVSAMDGAQIALDWMLNDCREWESRRRGREIETGLWIRAASVNALIDGGHTTVIENAAWAAYPDATTSEHESIIRAYNKLRNGDCPITVNVSELTLAQLVKELDKIERGKN